MHIHNFDMILDRRGGDSVKWNTYPDDVLPMWVADADFTAPEPLTRVLEERVRHGVFGYSRDYGDTLNKAAAHWMWTRFSWDAQPEWSVFSPSVVGSLAIAVMSYTEPGDSVLFLTPSYPPFFSITTSHDRVPLTSSMIMEQGRYVMDFADLEEKMSRERTRLLLLCNPHNPTGRVFTREELLRLGELCERYDVLVLSDEIHCDYVFPGHTHIPFPSLSEALAMRSLVTINPSKTFNIADLHASVAIIPNKELRERFAATAAGLALHSTALGVLAFTTAYMKCAWYADQIAVYVKANCDVAVRAINERVPGIRTYVPESTFLLWLDCRGLGLAQPELERFFLTKAKLALNSGTMFGTDGEGFMRMNLACPRATVLEGLARLEKAVAALAK